MSFPPLLCEYDEMQFLHQKNIIEVNQLLDIFLIIGLCFSVKIFDTSVKNLELL